MYIVWVLSIPITDSDFPDAPLSRAIAVFGLEADVRKAMLDTPGSFYTSKYIFDSYEEWQTSLDAGLDMKPPY